MSDRRTAEERAEAAAGSVETLLEALPYIREFHGRTVVIKYGGAAMRDESLRDDFATDVVLLKYVGLNPVIVHGGGPEITEYMEKLGLEVRFHEGLRVSDRDVWSMQFHPEASPGPHDARDALVRFVEIAAAHAKETR